jgi:hypothetical protein
MDSTVGKADRLPPDAGSTPAGSRLGGKMNTKQFSELRKALTRDRWAVADSKAAVYATDADRLANFKRQGARWGVEPMRVLGIYMGKHMDAIESYIRDHKEGPEGIQSNVGDLMNYCELLLAAVEDPDV